MQIYYTNTEDFYCGCYEMLKRGMMFKACFDTLTIHLTGGY